MSALFELCRQILPPDCAFDLIAVQKLRPDESAHLAKAGLAPRSTVIVKWKQPFDRE